MGKFCFIDAAYKTKIVYNGSKPLGSLWAAATVAIFIFTLTGLVGAAMLL